MKISEMPPLVKQADLPLAILKMELKGHVIHYRIVDPVTLIGRAKDCHLEIPDDCDNVERYHATIFYEQDAFKIIDSNGSNPTKYGTFVNGVKIEPGISVTLHSGDRIVLGGFKRSQTLELTRGACEIIFKLWT